MISFFFSLILIFSACMVLFKIRLALRLKEKSFWVSRAFYQCKDCFRLFFIRQPIDTVCFVLPLPFWLHQLNKMPQDHILWTSCPQPDTMNNGCSLMGLGFICVCSRCQRVVVCLHGCPVCPLWESFPCQNTSHCFYLFFVWSFKPKSKNFPLNKSG